MENSYRMGVTSSVSANAMLDRGNEVGATFLNPVVRSRKSSVQGRKSSQECLHLPGNGEGPFRAAGSCCRCQTLEIGHSCDPNAWRRQYK